jgi:fatty-acyl-CoA synthase
LAAFRDRGGDLAARASGVKTVFTLGPANYGTDLLQATERAGARHGALFRTHGRHSDAELYRRHHGQIQGRAAPPPANMAASPTPFEIPEAGRYLTVAPSTKVLPTLMRGRTVHMLKGFDTEAVLKTIERERINFPLFEPTKIYVPLDHPALDNTDLSSLELLLNGASAMSPSRLVEGIERIGPVFSQLYGQTECYPVSVLRKADHDPNTPELFLSCGFPIAACEVTVLCVRVSHVMAEYWKRPEHTAETPKNGWLHTGDIARRDERRYFFILDRKKDMIVSGGFNILPREVEDVLSRHADVAMVAVVAYPTTNAAKPSPWS